MAQRVSSISDMHTHSIRSNSPSTNAIPMDNIDDNTLPPSSGHGRSVAISLHISVSKSSLALTFVGCISGIYLFLRSLDLLHWKRLLSFKEFVIFHLLKICGLFMAMLIFTDSSLLRLLVWVSCFLLNSLSLVLKNGSLLSKMNL